MGRLIKLDILVISILGVLMSVLLAPVLLGWYPMFDDDIAYEWYPHLVYLARSFSRGVVPWWDPHTFCGASPEYLHGTYQVAPHWLLNFVGLKLAAWDDLDSVYLWGIKFPLWLGYLLGILGSYCLGRKGFGLNRPGSTFLAIAFGFSPSMISMNHNAFSLVALPWWVLLVISYARTLRFRQIALGAVVFAVLTPTYTVQVLHAFTVLGLFILGVGIWEAVYLRPGRGVKFLAGCLLMIGLGMLIIAPWWWIQTEIARLVVEQSPITINAVAGGYRSVPPRYFASLFVPWLFDAAGAHHTWSVTQSIPLWANEARLLRGFALMLLAFLGVSALVPFRDRREDQLRLWIWLSLITVLFALIMMAGRYTPFFRWLFAFIPTVRIPYSDRWHCSLSFGIASLGGIGVHLLTSGRIVLTREKALIFGLIVLSAVGFAVIWPFNDGRVTWFPAFRQLSAVGEVGWFLKAPLLYLLIALSALAILSFSSRRPWTRWVFPTAAAIEVFLLAGIERYVNRAPAELLAQSAALAGEGESASWQLPPVFGPRDCLSIQFALTMVEDLKDSSSMFRVAYYRSILDNGALINGSYSLLGNNSKPLLSRFRQVASSFASGFPYELHIQNYSSSFFSNMSVRYLWLDRSSPPNPDFLPVATDSAFGLSLYRNEKVLPRVFTLDRLFPADESGQQLNLTDRDLREVVVVDKDEARLRGLLVRCLWPLKTKAKAAIRPEDLNYFTSLQRRNRIISCDFSDPNQVAIEINVCHPAMLVTTDVWHPDWRATVDEKPVDLYRVNYLQRGVWLEKGNHRVEMRFRPRAIYDGLKFTLLGLMVCGVLLGLDHRRREK